MKNPNGYGSVFKLSGKRRKPFGVRVTSGWDNNGKQLYKYVGYYTTRAEAMIALAEYNKNPFDLDAGKLTFHELYERYSAEKYPKISRSSINGYKAAYNACNSLYNMRFADIRKSHLQTVIDTCNKPYGIIRKLKVLFNQLYKYAMENDLVEKDYAAFVEITHLKNTKSTNPRVPFSKKEIDLLWANVHSNEYFEIILMLIYNGLRISEFLDLRKEHVNLDDQYFDIIDSKTEAGIRKVPIADKVLPYYKKWYSKNDCEYLLSTVEGDHLQYRNYLDAYWRPVLEEIGLNHKPHDTRHTAVSLLKDAGVDKVLIKKIVGHKRGMDITDRVYTHFDIVQLVDAINRI